MHAREWDPHPLPLLLLLLRAARSNSILADLVAGQPMHFVLFYSFPCALAGQSKTANVLFAVELDRRLRGAHSTASLIARE